MRLLSYELGRETPTYPGNPPVELRPFTSIADGDVAMVVLARLRIAPADSAPCTIFAFSGADLNRDGGP
jgi:kynurenine formamidase